MPDDPSSVFRKRIRALRVSAGLSQEEFAERAGLNYKHFQEIERGGKTDVRLSTLVRIANALSIPLHHLFTEKDPGLVLAEESGEYRAPPKAKRPQKGG